MAQERTMAQGQCQHFLALVGDFRKDRDGIAAQCPRCRTWHVVIDHTERGISDYRGSIRTEVGPIETVVEVKDGAERFNFNAITPDQWRWLRRWEHKQQGTAWFWIILGTHRVGSKTDYPRQTYLVSRHLLCEVRRAMIKVGGVNNLPLNLLAAQTRIATRQHHLYATNLLADWRCDWVDGMWIPNADHQFWSIYGLKHSDIISRRQQQSDPLLRKGTRGRTSTKV